MNHINAAFHGSVIYGCQLVKKSKFMQKCINYWVTSPDNIIALRIQTSLSPPRPHGLGVGDAWHFGLTTCSTFTFVEISMRGFPQSKNQINKPASNKRRIFLAAVFHFKAAVEEHEFEMLNEFSCSPSAWTTTNAAIDESLCDTFLDENPNKQFSFEKQEMKLDSSCISFGGGSTRRIRYF